ncbi:hypothetical protein AU195_06530 [Mycobacterium sp. IS-1496]|uniref:bestrophin-like domain n=1 Tax=Mycobacterium sp. IS-1496 TaxID=1772284 RepID=UPI0007417265|nr:DUF4239 domain-containing protein [Mycobacterium sp. IS-1496]KUI29853.1 hypothetical protein AU195_06530 [Mycobacterium sp. IS-1496]
MSLWLVGHLPSWLLLLGLVTLTTCLAVGVQMIVRRRFAEHLRGDEHNDVTKFAFGVVGFVFAFFIGFVVSATWGQINGADDRARAEGSAGAQLARDLHVFDEPDESRIRQSLLAYHQAAITEWDEAAKGGSSTDADDALTRLYAAYEQVEVRGDAQKALLSASFSNLNDMSKARSERVLQARTDTGPPWSLWAVIFLTSGLLLGCAIIYSVEKAATHYTMVAILGVLVGAQLFLVLELSHPFVGEVATSSEPLHQVVRLLQRVPG